MLALPLRGVFAPRRGDCAAGDAGDAGQDGSRREAAHAPRVVRPHAARRQHGRQGGGQPGGAARPKGFGSGSQGRSAVQEPGRREGGSPAAAAQPRSDAALRMRLAAPLACMLLYSTACWPVCAQIPPSPLKSPLLALRCRCPPAPSPALSSPTCRPSSLPASPPRCSAASATWGCWTARASSKARPAQRNRLLMPAWGPACASPGKLDGRGQPAERGSWEAGCSAAAGLPSGAAVVTPLRPTPLPKRTCT